MTFGFSLIVRGSDATPENFTLMAERAESLDIDSLWCSAHIVLPPQVRSGYGMVPDLMPPPHWKERYWEPFTVISYLAARTTRLRFGTSIIVLPMHNPFEVAKQVAEVDELSGGRFTLGLGVGWFEEEFEILNQDFRTRGARTDEALALMRKLWGPDPVNFQGRFYNVADAYFGPKPVQQPGPPIWIAGNSEPALRRAARYADAWHPVRPTFALIKQARETLAVYLEEASRAPDAIQIAVKLPLVVEDESPDRDTFPTRGQPAEIAGAIDRFRELGVDHFVFDLVPETISCALDSMDRFAQDIRPHLH